MNQNTRQRIIGTVVLAVAAIILLPVIFDGDGSYQPVLDSGIPPVAERPAVSRSVPQRPVVTADTDAIRIRPEDMPEGVAVDTMSDTPAESVADTTGADATDVPVETASAPSEAISATQNGSVNASAAAGAATTTATPASAQGATPASTQTANRTTSTTPLPPPEVTAALDVTGLPEAWSVRVGAFSSQSNAANLVSRLQSDGLRAYTRPVDTAQGQLTAVFVGPLVDRAAAQTLLERLRVEYQLTGLIVRYQIEER